MAVVMAAASRRVRAASVMTVRTWSSMSSRAAVGSASRTVRMSARDIPISRSRRSVMARVSCAVLYSRYPVDASMLAGVSTAESA
ncbi:hypothetical protein BCM27_13750 [Gordonia terrae]|nr:hypothetical protein BCM27_13750 [Gordonia terrae]VTS54151.1 Uncharacterised protein [Gordonia terrae]